MNVGALLVGFALFLITIPFVVDPFRRKNSVKVAAAGNSSLQEHRKDVLIALRDLDFDFQLGQVEAEDYNLLRAQLVAEAGETIEKMNRFTDEQLEKMIHARRAKKSLAPRTICPQCGRILQIGDKFCSHCGASTRQVCPDCGQPSGPEDHFCSTCGHQFLEALSQS